MPVERGSNSSAAQKQKLAHNQVLFREINERIRDLDARLLPPLRELELVCECSDTTCTSALSVPMAEYERVRSHPARFLIHPGHEIPEIERVVDAEAGYAIVEKVDDAAELVAALDPRANPAEVPPPST